MKTFNRVLVALDLSDHDEVMLDYLSFFAKQHEIKHLHFVHVERELYMPEDFPEDLKEAFVPMDEGETDLIESKVSKFFTDIPYTIDILEGDPLKVLSRQLKVKDVDLLVLGKKAGEIHELGINRTLAKSKTSVLLIPANPRKQYNNIFAPVDFSSYSDMAAEHVASILNADANANAEFLSIVKVPAGYHRTGKSYSDMVEILSAYNDKKFEKLTAAMPADQVKTYNRDTEGPASEKIVDELNLSERDLVIVGSKGQSASSLVLLGSVVSNVVKEYDHAPILVLKKKGENKGFLELLFSDF